MNFTAIRAEVHFDEKIRPWDGFGFNYVETAQTMDYETDQQEYGGFSLLDKKDKQEIIELIFGEDGLKVGLVKMFHDQWHKETTGWNVPFLMAAFYLFVICSVILFVVQQSSRLVVKRMVIHDDGSIEEVDPPDELPSGEGVIIHPYGAIFFATTPATSVSRKSRPWKG